MEQSAWIFEVPPKAVLYAAFLLVIGAAANRWMLKVLIRAPILAATTSELDRDLERFGIFASSLALVALVARVLGHTAVVFSAPEALRWDNIRVVAFESRWGQAWRLQALAASWLLISACSIRLSRRAGWLSYTMAGVVMCSTIPRLGHGATSSGGLALHTLHLVSMSAWLGALAIMVALYFRNRAGDSVLQNRDVVETLFRHFSLIALPAAGVTALTGAIAASVYVKSYANLLTALYGRILLLKLGAFACVLTCGWSNWRRTRAGKAPKARTLIFELTFAALVILITSILTETEHP